MTPARSPAAGARDDEDWLPPPRPCRLAADEVHVWRASLAQPAAVLEALARPLSSDERERAARYLVEADRRRSVIARGLLRLLLGLCLDRKPERLVFEIGPSGKPALASGDLGGGSSEPCFNVSHSGDWILVALAAGRPVGIDVELLRPDVACETIAARFFSPRERRDLASLPAERRVAAFFACWTRKEAFVKARGDGLSLPLDAFDVSLVPGAEPRLLATRPDPGEAASWRMAALHPGAGHAAAVVALGDGWHLRRWHWEGSGRP